MKVSFERWGRNALSRLIDTIAPVRKWSPSEAAKLLQENPSAKILIIRPHQGLGDLLLATPMFRALKNSYPGIQIHFLADTYNDVAIQRNRRLDKIWVWDKKPMKNPVSFLKFIRRLRAERFSVVIPLSSHIPSFTSFLIARFSGAKVVAAFDTMPFYGGAAWSHYLAHLEIPNRPNADPEWVKFMALALPLGVREETYEPEFETGAENDRWANALAQQLRLNDVPQKKVGLFFGGNPDRPERLWPAGYWGDLAVKLQEDPAALLVAIVPPDDFLSGSRALERGVFGQVSHRLKAEPIIFSDRDVARVAAFLKNLDLFVCVDGGLFHIAVAAGIPTLGLFFKTDPARWKPPVPWATVLRPEDDLPTSLKPEEVFQKISDLVLKSKAKC